MLAPNESYHPKWLWRQDTPSAEAITLINAASGWFSLLKDGSISPTIYTHKTDAIMQQLEDLTTYLRLGTWDKVYPHTSGNQDKRG